ncbi:CopG family transcriptional regulator [Methylotenera sp. N17]|uniref:ribbon-helix-helix domain-containing protein n=1 Tax=Methylotenera sp. N17 TaxID=1502761 RepID=UPI000645F025|nr:CopG family transcriptional regulator [Methylotenera sp. N17]
MSEIVKTSFNLSKDILNQLEAMAKTRGVSKADILRQAIANQKFFIDTESSGGKILIEEEDKSLKRVIFR